MAQISPQQMKNKNLDLQKSREKGKEPERKESLLQWSDSRISNSPMGARRQWYIFREK